MPNVKGVGGLFFRARNPSALAEWYQTHLGVAPAPTDMTTPPWTTESGVTIFSPFSEDTDYFSADKAFMINFRVDDMEVFLRHFADVGIDVKNDQTMDGIGRFVHIQDPEGTPIELWQPA